MTRKRPPASLGMDNPISRRDFVNGVLVGSGSTLLSAKAPAAVDTGPAPNLTPSGSSLDWLRRRGRLPLVER